MDENSKNFHQCSIEQSEYEVEQNISSNDCSDDNVVDVIEKDNEDYTFLNRSHVDSDNLMGRVVNNEDEAYDLYNEYAIRKGFSVRRSTARYVGGKSKAKEIRYKEFRCSKAGSTLESSSSSTRYRNKFLTKSDCKAMIRFKIEGGLWTVAHFVVEHNHELASPSKTHLLRSNQSINVSKANLISSMVNAGLRTRDVFAYISGEAGGVENVGFLKRDCYNEVNRQKMQMLEAGDAQSLINHFEKQKAMDSMFSYDIQIDQENRLTNFFWRDGKSAIDYDFFGDVVILDTTYRKNRYNLVCAPFIGLNHHRQNTMFGCAFLLDETTDSFVWLFKSFLRSMGGKAPKTIFTDQDQAMSNAIGIVFPNTCHRLCLWHMSKHFPSHLGALNSNPEFLKYFKKCVYDCESEIEFQETWEEMLETFNLSEHTWLKKMYTLRDKWSAALSKDTFSGGLLSTQRSESTNSVLGGLASKTTSLTSFFIAFEKMISGWRSNEVEEDFWCSNGKAQLAIKNSGILNHAASVYTRKNLKLFEDEFTNSIGLTWSEVSCVNDVYVFQVKGEKNSRVCHVTLDMSTSTLSCSCKKFESCGIFCRHALKVLNVKNFDSIPERYILLRWSKEARKRRVQGESTKVRGDDIEIFYRNKMIRFAYDTILKSQVNEVTRTIVEDGLYQIHKDVQVVLDRMTTSLNNEGEEDDLVDDQEEVQEINDGGPILNPPRVKLKGVSNARLKGHFEKRKAKTKMGVKAKVIGKKGGFSKKSTKTSKDNNQQVKQHTNIVAYPPYALQYHLPSSIPPYHLSSSAPPYHVFANTQLLNSYGVPSPNFGLANIPYGSPCTQEEIRPIANLSQSLPQFGVSSNEES